MIVVIPAAAHTPPLQLLRLLLVLLLQVWQGGGVQQGLLQLLGLALQNHGTSLGGGGARVP